MNLDPHLDIVRDRLHESEGWLSRMPTFHLQIHDASVFDPSFDARCTTQLCNLVVWTFTYKMYKVYFINLQIKVKYN